MKYYRLSIYQILTFDGVYKHRVTSEIATWTIES